QFRNYHDLTVRSHRRSEEEIIEVLARLQKPVFQIRSSLAQFPMRERFVRLDFSISSVFSIPRNIPTPPPPPYKAIIINSLQSVRAATYMRAFRRRVD